MSAIVSGSPIPIATWNADPAPAMIVTTTHQIPGFRAVRTYGLVRGNTIRTKHLGKDILAILRALVGGEIHEYTRMMAQSREQALDRMIEEGLIEEARSFYPQRHLNSLNTVGYKELFDYFDGKYSLGFAIEKIKQHSRNYARKQLTWFKKDKETIWINLSDENQDVMKRVFALFV